MAPEGGDHDSQLGAVLDAWPHLPHHIKLAILALVETSR